MPRLRRAVHWPTLMRGALVAVATLSYLVSVIGMPASVRVRKDGSVPFMCQDDPCGCQTAEDCWRHCCCHSPEERMAWAEAHHVTPPDYAEKPSTAGWNQPRQRDVDDGMSQCACCHPQQDAKPSAAKAEKTVLVWVIGTPVQRCRGTNTFWLSMGAVSLPPPILTCQPRLLNSEALREIKVSRVSALTIPPDPPPRLMA